MRSTRFWDGGHGIIGTFLIILSFFLPCSAVEAFGPNAVTDGGTVVKWSGAITYHLESDLEVRGKDVSTLVTDAINTWPAAANTSLSLSQGALGVAVDSSNVCTYLYDASACPSGPTNDGTNPIVISEDGDIIAQFFGESNKFSVLGFAGIVSFNSTSGAVAKGEGVFNAACLAGIESTGCGTLSFSDDDFQAIVVHELGHFLGINHVDLNSEEAGSSTAADRAVVPTMYAFFTVGSGTYVKALEVDDQVAIAFLYPSGTFLSNKVKITGTVFDEDGTTEFQCANVIARSTASGASRSDALAFVSGMTSPAKTFDGTYELYVSPGQAYNIITAPISSSFTGSSGIIPCNGASGNPSAPTFDSQTHSQTPSGSGGEPVTGINFTLTNTNTNVGETEKADDGTDDTTEDAADTDDGGGLFSCSLAPQYLRPTPRASHRFPFLFLQSPRE